MKIFNWVHRRFHQKDEVVQDAAKTEVAGNGRDKVALLENAALDSVFDGWKEGIFAIGTFGLDPALLNDFEIIPKKLFIDDEDDQKREMEIPLVLKACKHGFFHDQKDDHPQCDETSKPNDDDDEDGVEDLADLYTDQVKKEKKAGERITLADLFWADSEKNLLKKNKLDDDVKVVHYDHDTTTESNTKHASNDDNVALISKKKLTKDDAARPIKKINRLVRKMLKKKKIHPEVENRKETARCMRILGSVKNQY